MTINSNERDIARSFGFSGGRRRIPGFGDSTLPKATSVAETLGVRPGLTVLLAGPGASALRPSIMSSGGRTVSLVMNDQADMVVFRAENTYSLKRLRELTNCLSRSGVFWVLWPQHHGHMTLQHVRRAAAGAGLVDIHSTHIEGMSAVKCIRSPEKW